MIPLGLRAPWSDRIHPGFSTDFTTSVRVIDRVHHHTAYRRTYTAPTHGTSFTNGTQGMLFVAYFAYGGFAVNVYAAHFARTQTQLCVTTFSSQQLDGSACRTRQLRTLTWHQLYTV